MVRAVSYSYVVRRAFLVLLAAFVTLAISGCPGPTFVVQQYGGPQRPRETIATLRVNGNEPVRLLFLDDQDVAAPIMEDGRLHIEMLPARHTLVVGNASAPGERYSPITFQAEAGKFYRVVFEGGATGEARIYEVERANDKLIRDVTQVAREEPPAAPKRPGPPPRDEDAGAATEPRDAPLTSGADGG
jgi:hypothetical protein